MFPYEKDATIEQVDAFMAAIGITIMRTVIKDDINAPDGRVHIRCYYLPHRSPDLAHPDGRGPGMPLAQFQPANPYQMTKWHQRKEAWFDGLSQHIRTKRLYANHVSDHREYQLLDHVANEVEKLGYPRTCAAYTAWLYGTHAEARHQTHTPRIEDPDAIRSYAALATDPRLNDVNRYDIAINGLPVEDLTRYLDTGAPYSLIRDLLQR